VSLEHLGQTNLTDRLVGALHILGEGRSDQTVSNLKQAGEKVKDAFNKD
jgi:hypothetical protein